MKWIFSILLACALCGCKSTEPQKNSALKRQVLSPLRSYLVTAHIDKEGQGDHEIVVTRPSVRNEIIRFPYSRQVDINWAPDESAMAIFDAMTPTENRVLLFALPDGRQIGEIRKDDTCVLNPKLPCGRDYARVFFSNLVWLRPDVVQVTVEMFGPVARELPPEIHATLVAQFGGPPVNLQEPK